jgi:hypothetical protein
MGFRRLTPVVLTSVALIVASTGTYFGCMHLAERQRINDADPAFRPLLHLRCEILSQPVGSRYCRYLLEFPPECELSDANVEELVSLNRLPKENTLDVIIASRAVTDASLPHLMSIDTFDLLDVTNTSISDTGINELRRCFPDALIPTRN